jgi:hypothetical protein
MFAKLNKSREHRPNSITYGTLFKAIAKLTSMDENRHTLVKSLFETCINSGAVDGFVLAQLRLVSPEIFREVVLIPLKMKSNVETTVITTVLDRMPSKWGRNAFTNSN